MGSSLDHKRRRDSEILLAKAFVKEDIARSATAGGCQAPARFGLAGWAACRPATRFEGSGSPKSVWLL